MKIQMRFQKILTTVSLVISALCIVLAIIFMSGNLANIMFYADGFDEGITNFTSLAQSFCNMMLVIGIIYLCCVLTLYIFDTNKRRNYYITNYISTGLAILGAVVASIYGLLIVSMLAGQFYGLDWETIGPMIESMSDPINGVGAPAVSQSPLMFIISYVILILPLLDAVALVLNLVWKIKLMKGEKELLEQGLLKEVA